MSKLQKKIDSNFIKSEVKRLDPKINDKDEAFEIATILLSGLVVGANSSKIAKFLELPIRKVKRYETNLRLNKIWIGNKTQGDWLNKKTGGTSFWLDVLTAQGLLKKSDSKYKRDKE